MRPLVYISVAAALLRASAAWCQEEGNTELERWIPSFGFEAGLVGGQANGFLVSNRRPVDDQVAPPGPFPGTPFEGDGNLIDPITLFTGELMTPGLGSIGGVDIPGHPRLFAHGDVGIDFSSKVILAKEGSPGELTFPPISGGGGPSVGGQGTETTLQRNMLLARAGLGVAFTTDLFGRRFRVKPSFEYLRERVQAEGLMKHALGETIDQVIELHNREEQTLNNVGGGLELEMDTVRFGPFVLSLFVNGQVYDLVDEREIDLASPPGSTRADCTNVASPNPAACWDVKLNSMTYSGAAGIRFRFFPFE